MKKLLQLESLAWITIELNFVLSKIKKKYFEKQFELCSMCERKLPLFLHLRGSSAVNDFVEIIERNRQQFSHGVVHSFDGNSEDLLKILSLDLHIGINGCSLKTLENLNTIKSIPLNRILIETDAPWCQIRPSHESSKLISTKFVEKDKKKYSESSSVKGRNEPANLIQVAEVLASVLTIPLDTLLQQIYETTEKIFFPGR